MIRLKDVLLESAGFEHSAGIIVFHRCPKDGIKYLLLHGDKIGWGFPKGHLDGDETAEEAARRETKEETGIIIDEVIPNFEEDISYILKFDFSKTPPEPIDTPINKIVTFYLGEAKSQEVKISHEHSEYKWVTYQEAQALLKFNNELLKKANKVIAWSKKKLHSEKVGK